MPEEAATRCSCLYKLLLVRRTNWTQERVLSNYRRLVKLVHPDKHRDQFEMANRATRLLNVAKEVIVNEDLRRSYNRHGNGAQVRAECRHVCDETLPIVQWMQQVRNQWVARQADREEQQFVAEHESLWLRYMGRHVNYSRSQQERLLQQQQQPRQPQQPQRAEPVASGRPAAFGFKSTPKRGHSGQSLLAAGPSEPNRWRPAAPAAPAAAPGQQQPEVIVISDSDSDRKEEPTTSTMAAHSTSNEPPSQEAASPGAQDEPVPAGASKGQLQCGAAVAGAEDEPGEQQHTPADDHPGAEPAPKAAKRKRRRKRTGLGAEPQEQPQPSTSGAAAAAGHDTATSSSSSSKADQGPQLERPPGGDAIAAGGLHNSSSSSVSAHNEQEATSRRDEPPAPPTQEATSKRDEPPAPPPPTQELPWAVPSIVAGPIKVVGLKDWLPVGGEPSSSSSSGARCCTTIVARVQSKQEPASSSSASATQQHQPLALSGGKRFARQTASSQAAHVPPASQQPFVYKVRLNAIHDHRCKGPKGAVFKCVWGPLAISDWEPADFLIEHHPLELKAYLDDLRHSSTRAIMNFLRQCGDMYLRLEARLSQLQQHHDDDADQ